MSDNDGYNRIEEGIEQVDVDLATARVSIVAVNPVDDEPAADGNPFELPATEAVILPVMMQTELGAVALRFVTRARAVDEGPRRTSLADTVSISTGDLAAEGLPQGAEPLDVPAWVVAGREAADLHMVASFPWSANPQGMTLHYVRNGGRGGRVLMSTETASRHQEAIEAAFHAFIATNPGMVDALEKGLALVDARILKFWADRLEEVASRQAFILRQGAEVIEEMVLPMEDAPGGFTP